MKKPYRHGDVLLVPVASIPFEAIEQPSLVLVLGEQTGHAHAITEGAAKHFKYDEKQYLKVIKRIAKIDHEDHGPGWIEPGTYEIKIRQEWQEDGWMKVVD